MGYEGLLESILTFYPTYSFSQGRVLGKGILAFFPDTGHSEQCIIKVPHSPAASDGNILARMEGAPCLVHIQHCSDVIGMAPF